MGHDVNERYEYEEKKLKDKARYAEQMQKYEEDLLTFELRGQRPLSSPCCASATLLKWLIPPYTSTAAI